MKKFLKIFGCLLFCFCFSIAFVACDQNIVSGKSAYDLAVENGYSGTVTEWLQSLNGVDGADGTDGLDGASGATGSDLTAESLFDLGVYYGLFTDDYAGYQEFLTDYLKINTATDIQLVTSRCLNQVVNVYCPVDSGTQIGSGVIYSMDSINNVAYVITNYHVVCVENSDSTYSPATNIHLYVYGSDTYSKSGSNEAVYGSGNIDCTYIGGSAYYDLAILKVTGTAYTKLDSTSAEPITIADTNDIQSGSTAIAIGNPMGEGMAVTYGVVSLDSEIVQVSIAGQNRKLRCLRMDTSINGGNSGGGVFNVDGELIGIANAKYSASAYENVANAILGTNVKYVTENIIYFHEQALLDSGLEDKTVGVHKCLIGFISVNENPISVYDSATHTNNKSADITISSIVTGSVAEGLGLIATNTETGTFGDIVLGLKITRNSVPTTKYFDYGFELTDYMLTVRPGDKVALIIKRYDSESGTYGSAVESSFSVTNDSYTIYKNNGIVE